MHEPVEEFVLAFTRGDDGGYRGQVLDSPLGPGESFPFALPWSAEEIAERLRLLGSWLVPAAESAPPPPGTASPAEELARELSQRLFESPAGRKLTPSLHRLRAPRDAGERRLLRLRLVLPRPGATESDPLSALPWELLRLPAGGRSLALEDSLSIVRSFDPPEGGAGREPLPVDLPLRVLLIPASPQKSRPLDVDRESREIQAVGRLEVVAHEIFRGSDLEELRYMLRRGDFHVVHFMGHSGLTPAGERGFLFEDPLGLRQAVLGGDFARELSGLPSLRLVVLNSCRTASVARALLDGGVETVVAMGLPISDPAAIDFSAQFYEDLTAGSSVETAVGSYRRAAHAYSEEWATPSVFLGGVESRLFDPGRLDSQPLAPGERLRLGLRSFSQMEDGHPPAYAQRMERESHRFLSLASCFYGRKMEQPKLWEHRVSPALQRFLAGTVSSSQPLLLDLAAHQTIAFTAGYYLGTNDGADIAVRQRGMRGTKDWTVSEGEVPAGPLWLFDEKPREAPAANRADLAVAVAIIGEGVVADVRRFLDAGKAAAGRLLVARIPEPGLTSVLSGRHALRLAETLAVEIWQRSGGNRERTVHLFANAPNGFLFLLGRVARNLGRIQLYEYLMGESGGGTYVPSLALPPARFERPRVEEGG